MQHALIPVLVQQQHACFQLHHDLLLNGRVLERQVVGVENRLAAFTACGSRGEVEKECPGCFGGGSCRRGGKVEDVRLII
jgi:hypothetical protein